MDKSTKKVKNMVFNILDNIYSKAVDISKSFETKLIPLILLNTLIEKSKLKPAEGLPEDFVNNYNVLLGTLYEQCKQNATKSHSVYPKLLKAYITIVKKSILDSIKN